MREFDIENLHRGNKSQARALKDKICDNLTYIYPRHSSSYLLKGSSVHLYKLDCYYAVTAIARLGLPTSLADDFDVEFQDGFADAYSEWSFVDALETLWEMIQIELGEVESVPVNEDGEEIEEQEVDVVRTDVYQSYTFW